MTDTTFILDNWTEKDYAKLVKHLYKISEEGYRQFSEKLIPGAENILGIKIPKIREIAKAVAKGNWREFLIVSKNDTFEEIVLRGAVIGIKTISYDEFLSLVKNYIPIIDNWALCDFFCGSLKLIKKYKKEFMPEVIGFLESKNPWIKRVGLVILKSYYIDEKYVSYVLKIAEKTVCDHYYVQMAHAWLIAEAYTKFPQTAYDYLKNCSLNGEILNKAIQKVRDSYRVNEAWKEKITKFRIKK